MSEPVWQGYLRSDSRLGVRNLVLVVYTVECASHVALEIGRGEEDTHVIGFPGCYDNAYAIRLMLALARHPNVGAVLAVGLGCEYVQPGKIAELARASGRPADSFYIQEQGGTRASIERGKQTVREMLAQIRARTPRVPMGLKDLVVGAEFGGSDGTSGLAGNPVVGRFYDRLVDAGGTAIFEEIVEMIGLRDIMAARAASPEAAVEIGAAYDKADAVKRAFLREKDRKTQEALSAIRDYRRAQWQKKVADSMEQFEVAVISQTHDEMVRKIEEETAVNEARMDMALGNVDQQGLKIEEEAEKLRSAELVKQFKAEMGLISPEPAAPAAKTIGGRDTERTS